MDARVTLPAVLGHEMSGTIAAIGDGVERWSVGERVTVMPLAPCGACPACRGGHSHICHNLDFLGIDSPGSMQSRWTVPAGVLVALAGRRFRSSMPRWPSRLPWPFTTCAGRGWWRASSALVVGGGPIGVLVACAARARGADVVVVELERAAARARGGGRVASARSGCCRRAGVRVGLDRRRGRGGRVRGVRCGRRASRRRSSRSAVRGRIVVVAIHATPPAVNLFRVFWRELTLIGARVYERRRTSKRRSGCLPTGAIPAAELITRIEPLERGGGRVRGA